MKTELNFNVSGKMWTIIKALDFAAQKHSHQRRKDANASPYINHPIALANVLCNEGGVCDCQVVVAALLHDTIEDTETTPAEIEQEFGKEVRDIVLEVIDDITLSKMQRKALQVQHAAGASERAKLVKLADKICNVRDLINAPPANWGLERKREYFDWAKQVVTRCGVSIPSLRRFLTLSMPKNPEPVP